MKYFFLLLLIPFLCFAQDETAVSDINELNTTIIPPTPEVASLGKYIETPVNEFTGIPKIQVPIYTIQQGRIKHDIGLSYHAQGVKVEEIASRVGMGWTLNAGGMIHRQMRGQPDESRYGFLNTDKTTDDLDNNIVYPPVCDTYEYIYNFFNYDYPFKVDYEPDQFSFSFGGYSGKFYFDQTTKEPYLEKSSPLKIERITLGFKITTPDGLEYYFGSNKANTDTAVLYKGGEKVGYIYSTGKFGSEIEPEDYSQYPEYIATWQLMEIYDPISKKSITFEYGLHSSTLKQRVSSSVITEEYTFLGWSSISYKDTWSQGLESEHVLDKINFDSGYIVFEDFSENTQEDRLDYDGAFALREIEIFDYNNKLLQSYGLEHFNIGEGNRLFLSGIKEYAVNSSLNLKLTSDYKSHIFEYRNADRLPSRFSMAQDFWGFHNGVSGNTNLIPIDFVPLTGKITQIGEANRHVNEDYVQDGILTKITYPTGGYANYTYESNTTIKNIATDGSCEERNGVIMENIWEEVTYRFRNSYNNVEHIESDDSPQYIMYFEVGGDFQDIEYTYNNYDQEHSYKWVGNIQKKGVHWNGNLDAGINIIEGRHNVQLEAGEYRILMYWDSDEGDQYEFFDARDSWEISFSVLQNVESEMVESTHTNTLDYYYTGGLRVKEVETNDLQGNINKTTYSYKDRNGDTSGKLVSIPYRLSDTWFYNDENSTPQGQRNTVFKEYDAISSVPLTTTNGSYTGYTKVTKINENVGSENNGKEELFFSFKRDVCNYSTVFDHIIVPDPISINTFAVSKTPFLNNEMKRGNLLSKIVYNTDGDTIQKITNSYDLKYHKEQYAYTMRKWGTAGQVRAPVSVIIGVQDAEDIEHLPCLTFPSIINRYSLYTRSNLLKEQVSTVYDSNGENPVTTTTSYNYENGEFPSLQTGSVTTNSKDEVIETKIYYPDDVTGAASLEGGPLTEDEYNAIERLQKDAVEHRIGQPIQQETYVNNVLTSVQRTKFKTKAGITLPASVSTALGSDDLEERLTYNSYTNNGNPEEVSQADGSHTSYIWGYNEEYPVVKVDNATIVTVEATLTASELEKVREGSYSESQMRSVLNKIRTGLPNAMVTTYTYDPLVGVTSITDPRGYTMYYEYDGFQRLEYVKDGDGNLLSKNEYNYKN